MHHVPPEKQPGLIAAASQWGRLASLQGHGKQTAMAGLGKSFARFGVSSGVGSLRRIAELDDVANWAKDAGLRLDRTGL
jgi:hypothetical protein